MKQFIFIISAMFFAVSNAEQINIPRIEAMPNIPPNYIMRNWKKVTLDYDNFVYNLNASGTHLPLTKINTGNGVNYSEIKNIRMDTYVGSNSHSEQAEAINIIPSIVGASLNRVDKTNQNGNNYVVKIKDYFNRANGQNVYLNNYSAGTGGDWWYEIMPNIFFYQMRYLYPNADNDFTEQMKTIAKRELGVVFNLGGNIKNWTFPNMNYRAYDLITNTPNSTSVPEPETAGSIAWLLYQAYLATDSIPFRQGAELALGFLNEWQSNPSYEIQLPYGIITAARMNAVEGTNYDIDKFLNWTFSAGNGTLRGWGIIKGNWNGYEMSGLIGEANDGNNDYAFVMNGFQHAAALAPLPKYDKRYARAIAKWMLNLSSASRFFYPNFLPAANSESTSLAWSNQYDLNSCIPYESIKENWGGIRPLAMGDALGGNWAATNLSLYSGSSVGYLAAVIDTTDVEGILQINMNKTDFSPSMTQYQSYLYYNPHNTAKTVTITLPAGTYDIYDAIQETKVKTSVSGSTTITVSPDNIMLLTLYPAGGIWKINGRILSVENGGVLDYHYGYNYQNSLRVVSLTAENNTVQIGDSVLLTCRTENGDNVNYRWYANDALVGNSTNNTFYYKPQTEGSHVLHCIATDASDTASSEWITVLAATFIAPEIESLILQQGAGNGLYQTSSTVSVSAAVRGSNYSINWTVSGGTLSFANDSLSPQWTLPNQNGLHTVTLTVENILGSETAKQTVLVKNITAENYYTPIIYYPFINGSTKNIAGNDFNAVNTGAVACPGISGTANNALQFGNSSQYLYIENTSELNTTFTNKLAVSFWMKPQNSATEQYIISHGSWEDRYKISIITPNHTVRWTVRTANGIADLDDTVPLQNSTWVHYIAQYTGYSLELYRNGVLASYKSLTGGISATAQNLTVARKNVSEGDYGYRGVLDEIRFFNQELSPADVTYFYNLAEETAIETIYTADNIKIYPNPSYGTVTVSSDEKLSVEIFSPLGVHVQKFKLQGTKVVSLKTSGLYTLCFTNKNGISIKKKLVVMHN
ncbi:MAG: PKD domain-containing protein [Bacteroidales bacterium]|jgi:hypothetical protein|nr:PKD domain-containing protein [Bacteroidales bacterium]